MTQESDGHDPDLDDFYENLDKPEEKPLDRQEKGLKLPGKRALNYRSVKVKTIAEGPDIADFDTSRAIAESAELLGIINPITVRQVHYDGERKPRTVLVSGKNRLQAAGAAGMERIDCKFIVGEVDELTLARIKISENLCRKSLGALEEAELITRWVKLHQEAKVSDQNGQKKRGRPRGGDSDAARSFPSGDTVHARRQIIRRSKTIARIAPEAKDAARKAGLNYQDALLKIAKGSGKDAQLKIVERLAPKQAPPTTKHGDKEDDADQSEKPSRRRRDEAKKGQPETKLTEMLDAWNKECRALWRYLPQAERDEFIAGIRRARSKVRRDHQQFVQDVFRGRQDVYASDLYGLAKKWNVSKEGVKTMLMYLRIQRKRDRHGRAFFRQRGDAWAGQTRKISDLELTGKARAIAPPKDDYNV